MTTTEFPDPAVAALLREAERRMVSKIGIPAADAALTVGTLGNLVIQWLVEHLGDELAAYRRGRADAASEALVEIEAANAKAKAYHYKAALDKAAGIIRNLA